MKLIVRLPDVMRYVIAGEEAHPRSSFARFSKEMDELGMVGGTIDPDEFEYDGMSIEDLGGESVDA